MLFLKHSDYKIQPWLFWPSTFIVSQKGVYGGHTVVLRWSYGGLFATLQVVGKRRSRGAQRACDYSVQVAVRPSLHMSRLLTKRMSFLRPLKFGDTDLNDGQIDRWAL